MCGACYQWSKKHPGEDPAGRPRLTTPPADGQCTVKEGGLKCTNAHVARGLCNMHHRRDLVHGDPGVTLTRAKGTLTRDLEAAAYAETDDCLFLNGYANRPSVPFNGVTMFASRAVWIIRHGDPGELHVLHSCNGGSGDHGCINIRHLYPGDKSRNSLDAVAAGTNTLPHLSGEDTPGSILTAAQVEDIRARWEARSATQKAMATEYGVSRALICLIANRKRWTSLE